MRPCRKQNRANKTKQKRNKLIISKPPFSVKLSHNVVAKFPASQGLNLTAHPRMAIKGEQRETFTQGSLIGKTNAELSDFGCHGFQGARHHPKSLQGGGCPFRSDKMLNKIALEDKRVRLAHIMEGSQDWSSRKDPTERPRRNCT